MNKLQNIEQKRKEFERKIADILGVDITSAQVDIHIFSPGKKLLEMATNTPGFTSAHGNYHGNYTKSGCHVGGNTTIYT